MSFLSVISNQIEPSSLNIFIYLMEICIRSVADYFDELKMCGDYGFHFIHWFSLHRHEMLLVAKNIDSNATNHQRNRR